ncbi:hypothetical protein L6452_28767 [Arctium lappa]|uniref:Uncharacterized protein n=1 Tax=Arctium lappa TaxID=4217 RepID=A0ACB8ZZK8_ARCLA|nr:hypothetical protein L6452_28767 [Arctium lappa]
MDGIKVRPFLLLCRFLAKLIIIHAKVPSIIVFGDSSVDAGNNNQVATILKSNFQPYGRDFNGSRPTGRFCNGRIATDFISEALGIRSIVPAYLDPHYGMVDFAKGVSFASAGTGYDNLTSAVLSVIPLWKELEYFKEYHKKMRDYLGALKAKKILGEALYLISLGTNDFLENYYILPVRSTIYSVQEYQDFLQGIAKNFIMDLYHLGARKISIAGLPPMGCLPLERTRNHFSGSNCTQEYNVVAKEFNVKLQQLVRKLNEELGGIQLVYSDVYKILSDIIKSPRSFGFEVAHAPCCASGIYGMSYLCTRFSSFICEVANKYVFWDSFHPSEKTNLIVADHIIKTSLARFLNSIILLYQTNQLNTLKEFNSIQHDGQRSLLGLQPDTLLRRSFPPTAVAGSFRSSEQMVGASSRLLSLLTNQISLLRHRPFALFRFARRRSLTFPLSAAAGDHGVRLSRCNSLIPIKLAQSFYSRASYNALEGNNQIPANEYHAPPSHPWLEWTRLLESLSIGGYFNGGSSFEDEFAANENLSMEFVAAASSCLAFARDRPDILGWLPRKDIEVLINDGYPFLFKNAHEIERRMRSFLQVEGSNEASSVDLMKYVLSYASNPIIYPERNIKETTESSVRTLLKEITNLSYTGQYSKQFQAVGRDEQMPRNLGPNITMKRGDWICPKCNFMNFARNTKCLECEELRPQRQLTDGEWDCPQCNFFNYRRNVVCLKCECRRPGEVPIPGSLGQAKTPSERQQIGSHYRNNYDTNGIPNGGNNFRVRNKNLDYSVDHNPDRFLGNSSSDLGTYSNNIDRGQNDRKDGYVPFVPLPADMFAKKPEKITNEHSEEQCSEKSTTYVQSRHISDADKEEKSERWFKKVKELHGVTGPTNDFPQIMPTRNGESRFVDGTKKDRPFSPYQKQHAMEQRNTSSFVPFPPDYFAKKDNQQQPKSPDSTVKPADYISSGHSQVNSDISSGHSQVNSHISTGHSQVNSGISSGHSQVNSGISYGHSQENQHISSTNKLYSDTPSSSNLFTRKETTNIGQKTPENLSGWTGKSLEGSAVTQPDPLDMSEEAKAERWFRRVAQIKDISELSQIPDEDFPSIMPMRKGVNRFVVSKRKTPLERRLTSPQYRKNLRIMSSEPMKREGDDDN